MVQLPVSSDLDKLIRHANKLEPLPASATRLTVLLAQSEWDLPEVVRVIELDTTLTARLLRVANSVGGGSCRSITTAREAVLRMGAATVTAIAMGIGVRHHMLGAFPNYASREDALWRHSLAAALAVQCMSSHCRIGPPPEAFTAALLHDVGKLVLCQSLSSNVSALIRSTREGGRSALEAEWEVLEITHPELGGLIAQHWRLPAGIVQGIALHHTPLADVRREHQATCRAVQLADCVAKAAGAPLEDGGPPSSADLQSVLGAIGVSDAEFEALRKAVTEALESTLELYDDA
jgi:HD-like signal output (HDOD) protein